MATSRRRSSRYSEKAQTNEETTEEVEAKVEETSITLDPGPKHFVEEFVTPVDLEGPRLIETPPTPPEPKTESKKLAPKPPRRPKRNVPRFSRNR